MEILWLILLVACAIVEGVTVSLVSGWFIGGAAAALIAALKNHDIAGAALDVFCNEPNINPEFKSLDNVVITPHVGVDSAESRMIIAHHTALNLLPAIGGGVPKYLVNRELLNK